MPLSKQREGQFLREALTYLAAHESRTRHEVLDHLESTLQPSGSELQLDKKGNPDWKLRFLWASVAMVKAGWMTKSGSGVWAATDAGVAALEHYGDSDSFGAAASAAYDAWQAAQAAKQRRAWLVRGSSVLGANLVPQWLSEGWCSLAASQLPEVEEDIDDAELKKLAETSYEHLNHSERRQKVDEIVEFVTRMKSGDVVVTTTDNGIYVGDIGDGIEYLASDHGRSNLRRPVIWQNAEAGFDFAQLPASLQAKLRTGATVADITGELSAIESLLSGSIGDAANAGADAPRDVQAREEHVRFGPLSADVARELLVSGKWLDEFVELLNETRQVVFFGPPGTGKTYLARKIAANLVGNERVRLVQFHPSYSYEDFFEGYRPATGVTDGVSLELRPGPLRKLATEARNHPDQAFILVIDELNRANIAKVFGELYFLLEYRDDAVEVLYGDEPFTLPTNLYFICTMNTADRSIALLDAAMRRRFAFVELHPSDEPTKSMLSTWLSDRDADPLAADLLTALNSRIDDRDAHIGPSYFMNEDQSEERLRRVFRTQIEPLLRETYYDRWNSVGSKFSFDALRSVVQPSRPDDTSEVEPPADVVHDPAPTVAAVLPPPPVDQQ
jgi:5-methylcytosine-specific restriction protein B